MLKAKEIRELVDANILTKDQEQRILDFYSTNKSASSNRLFIVFGILGALLAGLGIILILAHNWDQFTRPLKTVIAFLPLLAAQVCCLFVVLKKHGDTAWSESSAVLLILAFGAAIALISQIYHIPGDFGYFLRIWIWVSIPLIYILRSSMAALLCVTGITVYALHQSIDNGNPYLYWVFLLCVLPHYFYLIGKNIQRNFLNFLHWMIPASIAIALATVSDQYEEYMVIGFMSLFSLYLFFGDYLQQKGTPIRSMGYLIIGFTGTIVILLILSYNSFFTHTEQSSWSTLIWQPEILVSLIITLVTVIALTVNRKRSANPIIQLLKPVFLVFIPLFFLAMYSPAGVFLINVLIVLIGIRIILLGYRADHLGYLNIGLLILVLLSLCRFFDTGISFIIRGILFLSAGTGFFLMNYRMLKNRKTNAE